MRTLRTYFGSTVPDDSVQLPEPKAEDWFSDFVAAEAALLDQARKLTLDKAAIVLPAAGVSIPDGQSAVWNLASTIGAENSLLESFEVFRPVLVKDEGTADRYEKLVIDGSSYDLVYDSSGETLTLSNNSGNPLTVYGFILFPQYGNYITSIGETG